jgi:hypothetical protein
MGRFSRLLEAKGKDITIGDEVFNIKPLSGKHMGLFTEGKEDDTNELTYEMIAASLQQTDPTIVAADVEELPVAVITDLIELISEVNELK